MQPGLHWWFERSQYVSPLHGVVVQSAPTPPPVPPVPAAAPPAPPVPAAPVPAAPVPAAPVPVPPVPAAAPPVPVAPLWPANEPPVPVECPPIPAPPAPALPVPPPLEHAHPKGARRTNVATRPGESIRIFHLRRWSSPVVASKMDGRR